MFDASKNRAAAVVAEALKLRSERSEAARGVLASASSVLAECGMAADEFACMEEMARRYVHENGVPDSLFDRGLVANLPGSPMVSLSGKGLESMVGVIKAMESRMASLGA